MLAGVRRTRIDAGRGARAAFESSVSTIVRRPSTLPGSQRRVAAVYRELLKNYRPQDIGIYGCSAGGMLTGMAVAWFQRHSLPAPGAVGILCAGMTMASKRIRWDAAYTTAAIGESRAPPRTARAEKLPRGSPPSTSTAYPSNDPLAAPANSPEVLAQFSADADRDRHARIRTQFGCAHPCTLGEARRRCGSAHLGRHVSRLLLQRRCSRIARLLRRDREVLRSTARTEIAVLNRRQILSMTGALLAMQSSPAEQMGPSKLSPPPLPGRLPDHASRRHTAALAKQASRRRLIRATKSPCGLAGSISTET